MKLRHTAIAIATLAGLFATSAQALTITYSTVANAIPASASASFTTLAGEVDLALENTLATPIGGVAQVLTGISFDVTNLSSSGTASYVSGNLINVSGSGAVSAAGEPTLPWTLTHPATSTLYLSVFGSGEPDYGLLNNQADYASANNSIKNNGPHNPFYQGDVTFALSGLAGVSAGSTISNVQFHFGTVQESGFVDGDCTRGCDTPPVPEPETYAMMLAGLGAVGFMARRRRAD